jgi:uncharacterized repeat protein (TIGR01451 family)
LGFSKLTFEGKIFSEEKFMQHKFRTFTVMACLVLALVFGAVTVRVLVAGTGTPDLSASTLSVDRSTTVAGGSVVYTVVISNSGGVAATGVLVTDTLPTELTYQAGTFISSTTGATTLGYGDSGNVITWTGDVDSLGSVTLSYAADVADTAMTNDVITSTVQIDSSGTVLERSASVTVVDSLLSYFPIMFMSVPAPVLNPITGPTAVGNTLTASWNVPVSGITKYEVEEANGSSFTNTTIHDTGTATSKAFTYTASAFNFYCYRARAWVGTSVSGWSNVQCAVGNYFDDLSNTNSGWAIRQQDTDDTENSAYYQNGEYVVKIGGRWDYALASPLAQAPKPPYTIETRIKFDPTVDNLHGYGIVFGGNWNGQPCPGTDYSACFTHYYRFLVVWYGPQNSFRIQLKRIDYNDEQDNIGRGVNLVGFKDIFVNDSKAFNTWRIEVDANGAIRVFLNGSQVASTQDTMYINSPYFGIMASSDEYLGAEPHLDWFRVTKR